MRLPRSRYRAGLSAIELLVVLAVLLILLALMIPAVQRVREAAMRTQSMNNLKQMVLGVHGVHDTHKRLPPTVGELGGKVGTLHLFILPYIEQAPLYNDATAAVWDNEVWSKLVPIYRDPRDTQTLPSGVFEGWLGTTNYPANWMVCRDGAERRTLVTIPDGTSNTLMFAQRYQLCNGTPTAWGYPGLYTWAPMFAYYNQSLFQQAPAPADCDPERPQAIGNVMLVAMCDGHASAVSPRVSAETWANVCDPADGNVIGNDLE